MQNKKELINEYKNRKQIGGICKITNIQTNKMLLFIAVDIEAIKNRFEFSKKTNSCVNTKLQSDWDKYGANSFNFEVIEELERNIEQTLKEFNEDLNSLLEIYLENIEIENMY